MKNTICFLLIISISGLGFSQTVTTTLPDKSYGGTKTVTTTKDEIGDVTVTETKDSDGKVRERSRTSQEKGGPIIFTQTYYTKGGAMFKTVRQEFDNKQTLISSESKEYAGGNVIYSVNRTKKEDGTYNVHIEDKEKGKTYDRNEPAGATYIHPPDDFKHPEKKASCLPAFELYAGYSFLSAKINDKMESYPLGAELTATYNLNEKWSIQLDGSYHSKKKDDFKYAQSYVYGSIQYNFIDKEKCREDAAWGAFVRLLIGGSFFNETFEAMGYSDKFKDCGPAFGIGGKFEVKIADNVFIDAGLDYLGTKYDDDINGAFRAGAGVNVTFKRNRRYKSERQNY